MHGRHRAIGLGLAVLYLFTTALHSGILGALLTFSRSVWYPAYQQTAPAWGLSALEDQQLGGLIMWVPAGIVYIIAGLAFFAGWLRESEKRVARWEASETRKFAMKTSDSVERFGVQSSEPSRLNPEPHPTDPQVTP